MACLMGLHVDRDNCLIRLLSQPHNCIQENGEGKGKDTQRSSNRH